MWDNPITLMLGVAVITVGIILARSVLRWVFYPFLIVGAFVSGLIEAAEEMGLSPRKHMFRWFAKWSLALVVVILGLYGIMFLLGTTM